MGPQKTRLDLYITHPTRDLSKVCKSLGYRPKLIWKKGDGKRTPKGTKIGGFREYSYCFIDVESSSSRKALGKRVLAVVKLLKLHRAMLRRLSASGGVIAVRVGWFCEEDTGDTLDWQVMKEMAALRIALEFHIYVSNSEL